MRMKNLNGFADQVVVVNLFNLNGYEGAGSDLLFTKTVLEINLSVDIGSVRLSSAVINFGGRVKRFAENLETLFCNKGPSIQNYGLFSSHVQM